MSKKLGKVVNISLDDGQGIIQCQEGDIYHFDISCFKKASDLRYIVDCEIEPYVFFKPRSAHSSISYAVDIELPA